MENVENSQLSTGIRPLSTEHSEMEKISFRVTEHPKNSRYALPKGVPVFRIYQPDLSEKVISFGNAAAESQAAPEGERYFL